MSFFYANLCGKGQTVNQAPSRIHPHSKGHFANKPPGVSLSTDSTGLLERRLVELNSKSLLRRNAFEFNSTYLRSSKPVESVHMLPGLIR